MHTSHTSRTHAHAQATHKHTTHTTFYVVYGDVCDDECVVTLIGLMSSVASFVSLVSTLKKLRCLDTCTGCGCPLDFLFPGSTHVSAHNNKQTHAKHSRTTHSIPHIHQHTKGCRTQSVGVVPARTMFFQLLHKYLCVVTASPASF